MKSFMIVGFTALLQVNAGAAMTGDLQKMDACSFAKSVDMSADSSQCAKEGVDARGYKGPARVMLVGEEKTRDNKDYSAKKPSPPRPSEEGKRVQFGAAVFLTIVVAAIVFGFALF